MRDLTLINYSIEASRARPMIPGSLELDRPDGIDNDRALVSLVVFRVVSVRLGGLPLPSPRYRQLNCRAYVKSAKGPAVYFFALRPGSRMATAAARMLGVPARTSRLTMTSSTRPGMNRCISFASADVEARVEVGKTPSAGSEFFTERPVGYVSRGARGLSAIVATHELLKATEARVEEIRSPFLIQQGLVEPGEVSTPLSACHVAKAVMSSHVGD